MRGARQEEEKKKKKKRGRESGRSPARPDTVATFCYERSPQEEDNWRTRRGHRLLLALACCHATWPCCGAAVFALAGWRLPTALDPLIAFDCAWGPCFARARCHGVTSTCCHAAMLPSGHKQKDNKGTTGGEEEDNGRRRRGQQEEKKRTRRGKGKGQKEDNRRTRRGQEEVKNKRKGRQKEDSGRTSKERTKRIKGQGLEMG